MLSLTCKAAIKAVVYLGSKFESGNKSGIKEIAEFIDENEHTVGKLLQTLVKANIINSTKGPAGGFYLSKDQLKQPLIDVVDAIDGRVVFKECGLGLTKCSAAHPCPIHHEYKIARDIVENLFQKRKVFELCQSVNSGLAHLIN